MQYYSYIVDNYYYYYTLRGTGLEAYHVRSFSASQSVLHCEVLNTALSAGEGGWREPFNLPFFYSAEVNSKVEKMYVPVCKLW